MGQDKPRFIRKNGRIIPIRGKGKSGDNRTKTAIKKRKKSISNMKKAKPAAGAAVALGAGALFAKKLKPRSLIELGALGVASLGLGAAFSEITLGSRIKRSSKKLQRQEMKLRKKR